MLCFFPVWQGEIGDPGQKGGKGDKGEQVRAVFRGRLASILFGSLQGGAAHGGQKHPMHFLPQEEGDLLFDARLTKSVVNKEEGLGLLLQPDFRPATPLTHRFSSLLGPLPCPGFIWSGEGFSQMPGSGTMANGDLLLHHNRTWASRPLEFVLPGWLCVCSARFTERVHVSSLSLARVLQVLSARKAPSANPVRL